MPVEIFCCYARKDQPLLKELKSHLMPLQRKGLITLWADTDIDAGLEWEEVIEKHLNTAQIILFLVSSDFIASDYCYGKEMMRAMERHKVGEAQVVPIILRPVLWEDMLFGKLQALPTNAIPVTSSVWHDLDEALLDVAIGIHRLAVKQSLASVTNPIQETTKSDSISKNLATSQLNESYQSPQLGPMQKGNALEEAVHLIEQTILHNNPATKDAGITIEPKKIVTVNGVKHEIDLFITIDYGKGYKSVFIFECKNWEKAVGKNEIVVFSDKINIAQAQKGYFIAKSFGKYAEAQAKKDNRIELLTASTEIATLPIFIDTFHIVRETSSRTDLSLRVVTSDPQNLVGHTDTNEIRVRLRDEELSYQEFAQHIHDMVKNEVMNHEPTGTFSEGYYPYDRTKTFTYQPNELFVDGLECRELDAHVTWEVQIIRPKIVSQFDIPARGKVISLESDKLPEGSIKVSFINETV